MSPHRRVGVPERPVGDSRRHGELAGGVGDGVAEHAGSDQQDRLATVDRSGTKGVGDEAEGLALRAVSGVQGQLCGRAVLETSGAVSVEQPAVVVPAETSFDATDDDGGGTPMPLAGAGENGFPAGMRLSTAISRSFDHGPFSCRLPAAAAAGGGQPGQDGAEHGSGGERVVSGDDEQVRQQLAGTVRVTEPGDVGDQLGW